MKQVKHISAIVLAVVMTATLGCAANNTNDSATPRQSGGEYFDDTVITTKVKAAVLNEPTLKSYEVNVETYKGVVQLSGFVNSQTDINKAVEITRLVKGVVSVKNNMQLKAK